MPQNLMESLSQRDRARVQQYLDIAEVILVALNLKGRITFINDMGCALLGYSEGELLGCNWMEKCLPAKIRSEITKVFHGVLDGDRTYVVNPVVTKSGEERLIGWRNTTLRDDAGRVTGTLSSGQDITEFRKAEERLREYERAVEGLDEVIAVVDRDYRYRLANHSFLRYRRLRSGQVLGRTVSEVVGREFFEQRLKPKLDECFQGNVIRFELRHTYPIVGERHLSLAYFPVEGASGGVDRAVCILRDVTERKRAEEELNLLTNRLYMAEEEERRRIARELHDDLGQALVGLKLKVSLSREGVQDERARAVLTETRDMVEGCLAKVRTLAQLLHPPELDALGLRAAIASYVEAFRERSGIDVKLELSPEFPMLPRTAERALFRITQECLVNVQRHSGSGKARVRVEMEPARAVLEIRDDGVGMQSNGKTGVGLAGIAERVRQLNGTLEITSGAWGTLVRAVLPLGMAEQTPASE